MGDVAFMAMPKAGLKVENYEIILELHEFKSGFGFSKNIPQKILDKFQRALNELMQDGSVNQVLQKYEIVEN